MIGVSVAVIGIRLSSFFIYKFFISSISFYSTWRFYSFGDFDFIWLSFKFDFSVNN